MSFILKTLEKLIFRRTDLLVEPLYKSQHAYQGGKETESAIHSLISILDKSLGDKEIRFYVFFKTKRSCWNSIAMHEIAEA